MKILTKEKVRRTYTLPAETLAKFEKVVPAGKRGAAVNEAIDHWLEQQRLTQLRADIDEGLADKENEALYLEEERIWAPVSDELWLTIDDDLWAWDDAQTAAETKATELAQAAE